jgi:hypothetical protein
VPETTAYPRLKVQPLHVSAGLRSQACDAIKRAITGARHSHGPGQSRRALNRRSYEHHRGARGRDAERAERLVRDPTLGLAEHVEIYGELLDRLQGRTNEANGRRPEAAMRVARI